MKRLIFLFSILLMIACPMISYAGTWQQDTTGWRYQNEDGTYKVGWYQDVDSNWYYFDTQTTYMLSNTTTPDGYVLAADGKWLEGETNTMTLNEKIYDNKTDLTVTAYDCAPAGIKQIGYSIPVTVYYNNDYDFPWNRKATVNKVEVSKDGALYINYTLKAEGYRDCLDVMSEYTFEDGSQTNHKDQLRGFVGDDNNKASGSYPLLMNFGSMNKKLVSVIVYIDPGSN